MCLEIRQKKNEQDRHGLSDGQAGRERFGVFRENERNPPFYVVLKREKYWRQKCMLDGWRSDTKKGSSVLLFCFAYHSAVRWL